MATMSYLFCLVGCLVASCMAMPKSGPEVSQRGLDLTRLPVNTVSFQGNNVTFTCSASVGSNARIQWYEYQTTESPNGALISDGPLILPGSPNSARYSLNTTSARQFDLTIHNVGYDDGGTYRCLDSNAPGTDKREHHAQLTVLEGQQSCTTTVPPTSITIEDTYYTFECAILYGGNLSPNMRWSGPVPFGQAQSDTGTRVWSGMSFWAHRTMNDQHWTSLANFTDGFLPLPPDHANNVPTYEDIVDTPKIKVNWPPSGMYADPIKPLNEYRVGDQIECHADAFPTATFSWHNIRLNERIDGSVLVIPPEWEGHDNPMRCDAFNTINGFRFNRELALQVNVPIPPTTPSPTTPTTTTPPPAVSPCFNVEGRWESVRPTKAYMCLEVDISNGNIHGVLRNDSDTYWIDLIGSTNLNGFDHVSFAGIWAQNRAVSTFIGECSRCHGLENLVVSAISRSKGGPPCGQPGQIFYSQEFEFQRSTRESCPPITRPPVFGDK